MEAGGVGVVLSGRTSLEGFINLAKLEKRPPPGAGAWSDAVDIGGGTWVSVGWWFVNREGRCGV
jgi:hypothetical protein